MKIFLNIKNHFRDDWKHRRILFMLEMTGTISAFLASAIVSILQTSAPFALVFSIFLVSSSSGMISGYIRKSGWIVLTSFGFTLVNLNGLITSMLDFF